MLLLMLLHSRSCYRLRCRSAVTPLLLRYISTVAPLSLCCLFCCSVAPAVDPAIATLSLLLSHLLSLHFHSHCRYGVALVSLRYRSVISTPSLRCCSAADSFTPDVAPAIDPAVSPLLLLGLFTVVASRGRIRVTVTISDCQALVSSSSEGCSILQKTVKVEAYEPSILALGGRS